MFVITQHLILDYVNQSNKQTRQRQPAASPLITQGSGYWSSMELGAVLAIVILQILLTQQYNVVSLYITYAISSMGFGS